MDRRVITTNLKIPSPVVNWLKVTFVEDIHGALKKAEMYGDYEAFCKECRMKPKDPNTFGKYVLRIFPTAYPSRLGSILDGSQAHCYSGISRIQRQQELSAAPAAVDTRTCTPAQTVKVEHSMFSSVFCCEETSYMECTPTVVDSELEAMVDAMLAEADVPDQHEFRCPPAFLGHQPVQQPVSVHVSGPCQTTFFAPSPVPIVWWETEEPAFSSHMMYSETFTSSAKGDSDGGHDFTNTTPFLSNCYC